MTLNSESLLVDLLWTINSPSLVQTGETNFQTANITRSDVDVDELVNFVGTPANRVGHYFERLVAFYLTKIRKVELVAQQQQIVRGGRTLGEMDYLFRDKAAQLVHLETAVKFYLHLPSQPYNGSHLVGPNSNDSFQQKLDRLLNHQLKLTDHAPDLVGAQSVQRMAFVKGRIYYHLHHQSANVIVPGLADYHSHGVWFHANEWSTERFANFKYICVMLKPHWLSPTATANQLDLIQFTSLVQERFANSHRPIHGCFNGDPNQCFFVVSDNWPNDQTTQSPNG